MSARLDQLVVKGAVQGFVQGAVHEGVKLESAHLDQFDVHVFPLAV